MKRYTSYIENAAGIICNVEQGDLVIFADTGNTTIGNNPGFLVFGLQNPQQPNLINAVPFNKRFVGATILFTNNLAFLYTNAVFTSVGRQTGQAGDVISVDLTNIANPKVLGTLSQNGDPVYGGPSEFFGAALYSPSILFGAGTTLTGSAISGGAGALDVIDISNPASLSLANQVTVSGNGVQLIGLTANGGGAMLLQGNLLVATAAREARRMCLPCWFSISRTPGTRCLCLIH